MTAIFLFPGQGSQSVGMVNAFASLPIVRETFEEASEVLGENLWAWAQEGPKEVLDATVNTQPLMLTADIAIWRAWCALGGAAPVAVAGHSLGEYAALVAAKSLAFSDAVRLVRIRAEAMQSAVPEGVGAMAAILGLADAALLEVCAEAAEEDIVEAVNFNAPGQVVIAGHHAAVQRACALAKTRGAKRAMPLPVSVPSHCALMRPAGDTLREALADRLIAPPTMPVIHNADVCSYDEPMAIRDALVRQLYSPVRWVETIQTLAKTYEGARFAECGPGKVLAGLTKRIVEGTSCAALTDETALHAFLTA